MLNFLNTTLPPPLSIPQAKYTAPLEPSIKTFLANKLETEFAASKELLEKASLVDSLKSDTLAFGTALVDPEEHLFTHLHLGARALNTGFEGLNPESAVHWAKNVLEGIATQEFGDKLLPVPKAKQLLDPITQLASTTQELDKLGSDWDGTEAHIFEKIQSVSTQIAAKVQNLSPGESFLLRGGYSKSPQGHAMYYRFTREVNNTYTVVLYNAGEGANWQGSLQQNNVKKVNPMVVYSGVEEKELLIGSGSNLQPGIFQSLIELTQLPPFFPADKRFDYKIEDVWKAFFPIQHRMIDGKKHCPFFMTLQRSGTCAEKSLNACLLDLTQDRAEFKALNLNSRLLSLVNFYHAHAASLQKNTLTMSKARFQLREAAENFSQTLFRYAKGNKGNYPELSLEQLRSYYATARDILERVKQAEKAAIKLKAPLGLSTKSMDGSHKNRAKALKSIEKELKVESANTPSLIATQVYFSKLIPPEEILTEIGNLHNTLPVDSQQLQHKIEAFFSKLPIPEKLSNDPYWSKVGMIEEKTFRTLTKLFHYYLLNSTASKPLCQTKQFITVMKFLAIMHQLTWNYDQTKDGLLKDFSLDFSYFGDLFKKDPHLIPSDLKEWDQFQKLNLYFAAQKKPGTEIFNYVNENNVTNEKFKPELNLYVRLLEKHPSYLESIKTSELQKIKKSHKNLKLSDIELLGLQSLFEFENKGASWHFKKTGNAHIPCMKQMCLEVLAGLGLGEKTTYYNDDSSWNYINTFSGNLTFISTGKEFKKASEYDKTFLKGAIHDWPEETSLELSKPYLQPYLERDPEKNALLEEGFHLQHSLGLTDEQKRLAHLASACCEAEASVSTLFYRLFENPSLLEDSKAQALIQHILFKPCYSNNSLAKIPLFEDLKNRGEETLKLAQKAIEQGLQVHFYSQSSTNVSAKAALHFIHLGQQIEDAYQEIHGKKPSLNLYPTTILDEIEELFRKKEELSIGELAAVSLQKLNALVSKLKPDTWEVKQWKEIYGHWMVLSSLGNLDLWADIDQQLLNKVAARVKELDSYFLEKIKKEPQLINSVLDHVIEELGIGGSDPKSSWYQRRTNKIPIKKTEIDQKEDSSFFATPVDFLFKKLKQTLDESLFAWKPIETTLTFHKFLLAKNSTLKANPEFIQINLSTGQAATNDGFLSVKTLNCDHANFTQVFGQRKILVHSFQNGAQFADPVLGNCRLLNGNVIQRQIGDNWFTYIPHKTIDTYSSDLEIPHALKGGYCHWIGISEATNKRVVVISKQADGKDCYAIDEKGNLIPLPVNDETIEVLNDTTAAILKQFEDPNYILVKTKNGTRTGLKFTRYQTEQKKTLSFTEKEDKWLYDEDPNFHIDTESHYTLGSFSEFIPLIHKDGKKRKILIPNQKVASEGFSTLAKFESSQKKDIWENQLKSATFFEYRITDEGPTAETPEGWLMLAQIYFAQKNYLKAFKSLNKVTLGDELSPQGKILFKQILSNGAAIQDYSPNACALRLRAFWMFKKLDPFASGLSELENVQESPHKSVKDIYDTYIKGLNNIYEPLLLSNERERELISMLETHEFSDRYNFLKTAVDSDPKEINLKEAPKKVEDLAYMEIDFNLDYNYDYKEMIAPDWKHRTLVLKNLETKDFRYYSWGFLNYYEVFLKGSAEERKELSYMLSWRRPQKGEMLPSYKKLLHFAYKNPSHCPPPIDPSASHQAKIEWFVKIIEAYREYKKNHQLPTEHNPFTKKYDPSSLLKFESTIHKGIQTTHLMDTSELQTKQKIIPPSLSIGLDKQFSALKEGSFEKPAANADGKKKALFKIAIHAEDLAESEKPLFDVIESESKAFNQELKLGSSLIEEEKSPLFKTGQEKAVEKELRAMAAEAKLLCDTLEKKLLAFANKLPLDEKAMLQVSLKKKGYASRKITPMDLARAAALGTVDEYLALNPALTKQDAEKLHKKVLKYLVAKTSFDQIQRALTPLEEISLSKGMTQAKREALLTRASEAIHAERQYIPEENCQALYFEYASGLRLRKQQTILFRDLVKVLIKKGKVEDRGLVFQMIQNGGKSSVILSRLMELFSELGYLSIMVCHHSQMSSAQGNMKNYQRTRFDKNVIPLNYDSSELNKLSVLTHIEKTMREAEKNKDAIVINSNLIQALQLQMITLLKAREKVEDDGELKTHDAKITLLQKINQQILENGIGLFDEVHLILSILQQANFPCGARHYLLQERVNLVKEIFHVLSTPKIDKLLRLSNNEQSDYIEKDYWSQVVPKIGRKLFKKSPLLKLEKTSYLPSFIRYISNGIDPKLEKLILNKTPSEEIHDLSAADKQDIEFLKYLHFTLFASSEVERKEAAHLIGLARGIIGKILPKTLRHSFNRDYGIDPHNPEKIIPFLAVDVPADTEFGHVYQHLCYAFQSAINAPIHQKAIEKYAKLMTEIANIYVVQGELFDETAEAEQFFNLTGIKLADAMKSDNIVKATNKINKDQSLRIEFQAESASRTISYFNSFYSNSPLALIDQFYCPVGCSASVDNLNSFNPKIAQVIRDKGAEGKIISTLLKRFDNGKKEIPAVDPDNLAAFIKDCLEPLKSKNSHCLVDGGGILKRFKSQEVAAEILSYFGAQDQNKRIKGVIFYHRSPEKEGFALLKAGSKAPIFLLNTTKEEIEKHGIEIKNLFFSLDELRAVGSDVPMPEDAIGVGTITCENLSKIGQMLLRLRGFFYGQDFDLVTTESSQKSIIGNSKELIEIIKTALKNRAVQKSEETFRSFKEQIPNFFRTHLVKELQKHTPAKAEKVLNAFHPFFETTFEDLPFEQFGCLDEPTDALEIFKQIGAAQKGQFEKCVLTNPKLLPKETILKIQNAADLEIEELIAKAKTLPELKCKFDNASGVDLGIQIKTSLQTNLHSENHTRVSLEVNEEQKSYMSQCSNELFQEIPWNHKGINPWNPFQLGPELFSLSSILDDCDVNDGWIEKKGMYRTNYSSLFPSNLKMTENLKNTLSGVALPIFHPLQKQAENILIRRREDNGVECIMLSQKDTAFWLKLGQTPKGIWLMNAEGVPLIPCSEPLPTKDQGNFSSEIEEALWFANLFNGNIAHLIKHPILSEILLGNAKSLMHRFLYQRTAGEPLQRKLLEQSFWFSDNPAASSLRVAKEMKLKNIVSKMSTAEIEKLAPELVRFIPKENVKHLKTKEQLSALLASQINSLNTAQVNLLKAYQIRYLESPELIQALNEPQLIKRVAMEKAKHLLPSQHIHHPSGVKNIQEDKKIQEIKDPELISYLKPQQMVAILPEQVPYINLKCVPFLNDPVLIRALKGRNQINAIDPSFLKELTPEQIYQLRDSKLIKELPLAFIQYLHPLAIQHLDVEKQLPHINFNQIRYISKQQYQTVKNYPMVPDNLLHLWNLIRPEALKVYQEILKRSDKTFTHSMPGMNDWQYLLEQMDTMSPQDYAKVKKLSLDSAYGSTCLLHIPPQVFLCNSLEELSLVKCNLSQLEGGELNFDEAFPNLKSLYVNGGNLKHFPSSIRKLTCLEKLSIKENSIKILPPWIGELKHLKQLDLYKLELKELPPEIGNLDNLTNLLIDDNELTHLPEEIGKLSKLTSLYLMHNQLTKLPDSIGNLTELSELFAQHNQLIEIPKTIFQIPNLDMIYLHNNCLTYLPPESNEYSSWVHLFLGMNLFKEIPENLPKKLHMLDLEGCAIEAFPEDLERLKNTHHLHLGGNPLKTLPNEIHQLTSLKSLFLQGTKISTLPESMGKMSKLNGLNLSHTLVSSLPSSFVQLSQDAVIGLKGSLVAPSNPMVDALKQKGIGVLFDNMHSCGHFRSDSQTPDWVLEGKSNPEGAVILDPNQLESFILESKFSEIQQLVKAGLNPNTQLQAGKSLLEWAILQDQVVLVKELILKGSDLSVKTKYGTPLITLLCHHFTKQTNLLLLAVKKRGLENLSPEEIKSLLRVSKGTIDFTGKFKLFETVKSLSLSFMPESTLASCLRQSSNAASNDFWKKCLQALSNGIEHIHFIALKLTWGISFFLNRLFYKSKQDSWEEIGIRCYFMERKIEAKRNEMDKWIDKLSKETITLESFKELPAEQRTDILNWARHCGNHKVVAKLVMGNSVKSGHQNRDKVITNLFLDKCWIMTEAKEVKDSDELNESGLYGIRPHLAAASIAEGIRNLSEKTEIPENVISHLNNELLPALERASAWDKLLCEKQNVATVTEELLHLIGSMKENQKVLVPIGSLEHNFLIQLKKYKDATFALKVVNTGLGLSHHPRFGEERYFQTFVLFQDIPEKSLLESDVWKNLFNLLYISSDNVNKHYEYIQLLSKGGKKVDPSKDRLDYSTAQLQGSCGASPWWSWLRHEIVDACSIKGDRKIAYAEWRLLKNEIKRQILQRGTKESVQDKVFQAASAKIKKHAQLAKLQKLADGRALFNETIKQTLAMLEQLFTPLEITNLFGDLKKDYLDYENTGSRWHILRETSKKIASEAFLLKGNKKKKFLESHLLAASSDASKRYTYLSLLDLETTEEHLKKLLQDLEKEKDWKTIGNTIGRLALDPKFSSVAIRLAKQWLTLSDVAKTSIVDKKSQIAAEETLLKHFLHFVALGKGQDRTLHDLAVYFRKCGKNSTAEKFWKEYAKYAGSNFGDIIASDSLEVQDLELIANQATTIDETLMLLLAMKHIAGAKAIQNTINKLIDKALQLDDKMYSKLKMVAENLYTGHFDYLAEKIHSKVKARLST